MKRFFNWVLVLGALVGVFYLVGLIVPRSQTRGSKMVLVAKPDAVYAAIADVSTWPRWHPEIATAEARPARNEHQIWLLRTNKAIPFELEVNAAEEDRYWQASYTVDGTRTTLRYDTLWYGEGSIVQVTKTSDTRDPWLRARRFLWSGDEVSPVGLLNALAMHFGEAGEAEER